MKNGDTNNYFHVQRATSQSLIRLRIENKYIQLTFDHLTLLLGSISGESQHGYSKVIDIVIHRGCHAKCKRIISCRMRSDQ